MAWQRPNWSAGRSPGAGWGAGSTAGDSADLRPGGLALPRALASVVSLPSPFSLLPLLFATGGPGSLWPSPALSDSLTLAGASYPPSFPPLRLRLSQFSTGKHRSRPGLSPPGSELGGVRRALGKPGLGGGDGGGWSPEACCVSLGAGVSSSWGHLGPGLLRAVRTL